LTFFRSSPPAPVSLPVNASAAPKDGDGCPKIFIAFLWAAVEHFGTIFLRIVDSLWRKAGSAVQPAVDPKRTTHRTGRFFHIFFHGETVKIVDESEPKEESK